MKKWTITIAVAAALAAMGFYSRIWLPKVLPFLSDHENADTLKSITSLIQITLWVASALAFIINLWRQKKKSADLPIPAITVDKQFGGINIVGGEPRIYGDLIGGDKTEGDAVAGDKIAGNKYVQLPAPPVLNALHQLPSPPADFTGRKDELKELLSAVKTGGVTISGLQGLGGVGKTALALKLAEQLKPDYPDAQFYLDLKGVTQPLTPRDAMAHVVRAGYPTAQLPETAEELAPIFRSVLDGKRALLLMDNARDAEQVAPLIPPADCLLLVTSRKHFTLPGLVEKNLDKLSREDARDLLLRIAPRLNKEKPEQVDELARLCGYLPLALRAVASALHTSKNISLDDCVSNMADRRQRLKLTEANAALQSSYELLADGLQKKFRFLAVFPDTLDHAAAAAVWDIPVESAPETLGELLSYSLVDFDETTKRYSLHDLVRLFAGQLLNDEERYPAQKRHAGHYLLVLTASDQLYLKGGKSLTQGLTLLDAEWTNIQTGHDWVVAHQQVDDAVAEWCWRYTHDGAYCLSLRLHPREYIRWLEPALAAAQQLKQRNWEGTALGNLGNAYEKLGEYRRAIVYQQKRVAIARSAGDHNAEAHGIANLGNAYFGLGDYSRAIEYIEQSIVIADQTKDRRLHGRLLANLGLLFYTMGKYDHAIERCARALAIIRELGDRLGESMILGYLGVTYEALGELRRAIEYQDQRLQIAREIGDRRGQGEALGNLGNAYDKLGELHTAITYYDQQLLIAREIEDRLGEATSFWNSATTFYQLGDRQAAIARAEAALKIFEAIEAPQASTVRNKLAELRAEDKARGQGSAE